MLVPFAEYSQNTFSTSFIATRALAITTTINALTTVIQTGGYRTGGDGGGAIFKRGAGPYTDGASFQSADGAWWLLTGNNIFPEMFGAYGDGTHDDIAALRLADAWFGGYAGELWLTKRYAISDTWALQNSVAVTFSSWGTTVSTNPSNYIKWIGVAGKQMVVISGSIGTFFRNARFIGNSAAKPSCAIEINQGTGTQINTWLDNIFIGPLFDLDTDNNPQFTDGIRITGTQNGDTNKLSRIHVYNITGIGIDVQNPGASETSLDTCEIQLAATGVRTVASLMIYNHGSFACSDSDFEVNSPGRVYMMGFVSEGSGRMVKMSGSSTAFELKGGAWQIGTSGGTYTINPDGYFVYMDGTVDQHKLTLEDFSLQNSVMGYTTPIPKIACGKLGGGISAGTTVLRQTWGISTANIDVGVMIGTNDSRPVIFEPALEHGQDPMPSGKWLGSYDRVSDRTFRSWVNQQAGEMSVFGGPFYTRQLATPATVAATPILGSGATVYSYRVTALTWDGGETAASPSATCSNNATLDNNNVNRVSWLAVQGAKSYKIYGDRGSGLGEKFIIEIFYTDLHNGVANLIPPIWDDRGTPATGATAFPTFNTTGNDTTEGDSINGHLVSVGSTPTMATGAGAGGTPSFAGIGLHDTAGKITITTGGTAPTANSTICTVTFARPYSLAPIVMLTAGNNQSSALFSNSGVYVVPTTTGFDIRIGSTALANGNQYIWYYHVIQG